MVLLTSLSGQHVLAKVAKEMAGLSLTHPVSFDPFTIQIASNNDGVTNTPGYFVYSKAYLIKSKGKYFAMMTADKTEGWPADCYVTDLVFIPIERELKSQGERAIRNFIHKKMGGGQVFQFSPLIVVDGQMIGINSKLPSGKALEALFAQGEYMIKRPIIEPDRYTLDLRPVYQSGAEYKPELVIALTKFFTNYLR